MRRLAGVALVAGAIVVSSGSARADTREVVIRDAGYEPAQVTITEGDTVTWTYSGSDAHSVTSDDGSFDSSPTCLLEVPINCMGDGSTYPHTFYSAGTFTYHCRVHDMTGTIVVQAAPTTTTSTTAPTTTSSSASSSSDSSSSNASDQPTITQASLPTFSSPPRVAQPKSIIRAKNEDEIRPWVLAAIGIAGITAIAGIVLVRRGRVPLG